MSGTIAYVQRQKAEHAAAEAATVALTENQQAVQTILTNIVKTAAGWSQIDPEFQATINTSLSGKIVDLDALTVAVAAWQTAKNSTPEA